MCWKCSHIIGMLFLISLANAASNTQVFNYTIIDENGDVVSYGLPSYCSSPFTDTVVRNVTAGSSMTLYLNITNIGDSPEDGLTLYGGKTYDEFSLYRGLAYENGPVQNFTYYNNKIKLTTGESIILIEHLNTTPYENALFEILIAYKGANQNENCRHLRIGVNSTNTFRVIWKEYQNNHRFNITNFNDSNSYSNLDKNWSIFFNATLVNIGNIDANVHYDLNCYEHRSDGTDVVRRDLDCSIFSEQHNDVNVPVNSETKISCALFNATNSSGFTIGECGNGLYCYVSMSNTTYNYSAGWGNDIFGVLGGSVCPPPKTIWKPFIEKPGLGSLWAVPGLDFNLTMNFDTYWGQGGNYTQYDNINITSFVYDNAYLALYSNSQPLLPAGKNLNVTSGRYTLMRYNITLNVPHGSTPEYYITKMYPSAYLVSSAAAAGETETAWMPCTNPSNPGWLLSPLKSLCEEASNIELLRLVLVENTPKHIVLWVHPGDIFYFNYTVNNILDYPSSYTLVSSPMQPSPITLAFSPNPISVGRALSSAPGNANGTLVVTVPSNTPITTYFFTIRADSQDNPTIYDFAELEIHVVAHDIEVVAINKTPDMLIYDPARTPSVNLSVTIKNNLYLVENASLNLTVGGIIKYIGCGGQNITLNGYESKTLNCSEIGGAMLNLSDFTYENVVLLADLALLTGLDTNPKNNHLIDIITIVQREAPTVALPETNFAVVLLVLLASIFIRRRWNDGK
ncbi:MAG: hypothetical protein V1835_07440 [Candidatus Micrarchaeota archaeon]